MPIESITKSCLLHSLFTLMERCEDDTTNFIQSFKTEINSLLVSDKNSLDIIYKSLAIADNLYAFTKEKELKSLKQDQKATLESIFTLFGENSKTSSQKFEPDTLSPNNPYTFPRRDNKLQLTSQIYQNILSNIKNELKAIEKSGRSIEDITLNEWLQILEEHISYIPATTYKHDANDISLYMYAKISTAFASCIANYLQEHSHEQILLTKEFDRLNAFQLISADISGIQDFIYTVKSKEALKSLRGRSFYLEILVEHIVDTLLKLLNLSRANVLYIGGGHFYLLIPNNDSNVELIEKEFHRINKWLLKHMNGRLYIAFGNTACSINDFTGMADGKNAFHRVSEVIRRSKLNRYENSDLEELFDPNSKYNKVLDGFRECSVCHTSSAKLITDKDNCAICPVCTALTKLGKSIVDTNKEIFTVATNPSDEFAMHLYSPNNSNLYLENIAISEWCDYVKTHDVIHAYVKNASFKDPRITAKIWLADYTSRNNYGTLTFEELAKNLSDDTGYGIKRIGVLRADVDDLGAAFMAGFISPKNSTNPQKYATLIRQAELSKSFAVFFKFILNKMAAGQYGDLTKLGLKPFKLFNRQDTTAKAIHIIYSGGDDVFLVGNWMDVIELALDIRKAFSIYTDNKVTMSAGIGLFNPSYPIKLMAEQTALLEEFAKTTPTKDSIALFGQDTEVSTIADSSAEVYTWQVFEDKVCNEKLKLLLDTFTFTGIENASENKIPMGKSKLYNILSLLRAICDDYKSGERINIARFLYAIARAYPTQNSNRETVSLYENFNQKMYKWIRQEKDRQELITAIKLIIYAIREVPNGEE